MAANETRSGKALIVKTALRRWRPDWANFLDRDNKPTTFSFGHGYGNDAAANRIRGINTVCT